jgi:hypothetical protein
LVVHEPFERPWCLAGSYVIVVHAHHDGDVVVLRGGADEHLLGAGGDVRRGLLLVGEEAGALEHDVDAEGLPGQLFRVLDGERPAILWSPTWMPKPSP